MPYYEKEKYLASGENTSHFGHHSSLHNITRTKKVIIATKSCDLQLSQVHIGNRDPVLRSIYQINLLTFSKLIMTKQLIFAVAVLFGSCDLIRGSLDNDDNLDDFMFTRVEPANDLGITTKIIAHIHRPANKLTETWRLNKEFTPPPVFTTLSSMCGNNLIDKTIKWSNCEVTPDGLTAYLTYGVPEPKNKTLQYLEMRFEPFERVENGMRSLCNLAIVWENPAYFLVETYSKIPSNDSLPKTPEESVDTTHHHQLGRFGTEFLGIYGNSIDQDGIYNFDKDDYYTRGELYECFLSIGSSESVSVIQEKCPIKCAKSRIRANADQAKIKDEL